MPFIIPFIPLIAAGVGAATTIAGIESQPSSAPSPLQQPTAGTGTTTPIQPSTAGLTAAQKALAQQSTSNVQSSTSGFATPDYIQSLLQGAFGPSAQNGTGSGATGDIQSIVNQAFGLGSPGQSGYSGGGSGGGAGSSATAPANGLAAGVLPALTSPSPTTVGPTSQSPSPNLVGSLLEQNFSGFAG